MMTTALVAALALHQPYALIKSKVNSTAEDMDLWRTKNLPRASLLNDSWSHKVHAFRVFYERPINPITQPLTDEEIQLHESIIGEEWKEFWHAVMADDLLEIIDGGLDLIYTVLGLLLHRGVPPHIIDACMEEIHASNMTKANEDGTPLLREDGKILKGPAYVQAKLALAALKATPPFNLVPTEEPTTDA